VAWLNRDVAEMVHKGVISPIGNGACSCLYAPQLGFTEGVMVGLLQREIPGSSPYIMLQQATATIQHKMPTFNVHSKPHE